MSSSSSPCAACKLQRRKCTPECVFAPYFPPDHPQKFASVHKIFGASNIQKLLNELPPNVREDAVNSLAYEANARVKDPVYGCVGYISMLQQHLKTVQDDLNTAKKELASYAGPAAVYSMVPPAAAEGYMSMPSQPFGVPSNGVVPYYTPKPMMGMQGGLVLRDPQQQQILQQQQQMYEAQQLAMVMKEQQDVKWGLEQQNMQKERSQQELLSFDGCFNGSSTASGNGVSPSLALGSFDNLNINSPQLEQLQPQQHRLLMQQPKQQQQQTRGSSEEYPSAGPAC